MKKTKEFLRAFYLTIIIVGCLWAGVFGIAKAYENTRMVGFGEYRKAFDINEKGIRILDFYIDLSFLTSDGTAEV